MSAPPAISVTFRRSGRGKAQCPPHPAFPNGRDMDVSGGETACMTTLPYPARECGIWEVRCALCGQSAGISAAGRCDDPKSLKMPCNTYVPSTFDPRRNADA